MFNAAVLGSPVAHSLSPAIHNAGYAAKNLDWHYTSFELSPDELPDFLAACDETWRGFSITRPLKRAAAEVAEWRSSEVELTGVANTLVRTETGWRAYNTDIYGLSAAVRPHLGGAGLCGTGAAGPIAARPISAAILGSGATAVSTLVAARDLGVSVVTIYARNAAAATELAQWGADLGLATATRPLAEWPQGDEQLVLSTLPPGSPVWPLSPRSGVLFDVVYANWPTKLAQAGLAAGMMVVSGLDMLVHQAVAQFELFTGCRPDSAAMFAVVKVAAEVDK